MQYSKRLRFLYHSLLATRYWSYWCLRDHFMGYKFLDELALRSRLTL